MKVTGLNHITLAVADVERALAFYRDVLVCPSSEHSAQIAA